MVGFYWLGKFFQTIVFTIRLSQPRAEGHEPSRNPAKKKNGEIARVEVPQNLLYERLSNNCFNSERHVQRLWQSYVALIRRYARKVKAKRIDQCWRRCTFVEYSCKVSTNVARNCHPPPPPSLPYLIREYQHPLAYSYACYMW